MDYELVIGAIVAADMDRVAGGSASALREMEPDLRRFVLRSLGAT